MMKVIISILLSAGFVLCEKPFPYPSRGFRPNPPFNLPVRRPQTTYGVPNAAPSKFTQPQTQYGPPNTIPSKFTQPQMQYGPPNAVPAKLSQPQTQYGVSSSPSKFSQQQNSNQQIARPAANQPRPTIPSTSYGVPVTSVPYRTITDEPEVINGFSNQEPIRPTSNYLSPNFNSKQTIPSTSYGVPVTVSPYKTILNEPQITSDAQNRPSTLYGAPDNVNIEALEQIHQLNLLLQLSQSSKSNQQSQINPNLSQSQNYNRDITIPNQQYLPVKEATNFRSEFDLQESNAQEPFDVRISNPTLQQPSQQYLPVKDSNNFDRVKLSQTVTQGGRLRPQNLRPGVNYEQPALIGNGNDLLASKNSNLNAYNTPDRNHIEIQRLNVRALLSSGNSDQNNRQIPATNNKGQQLNSLQQSREFGGSNIQGTSREQIDEKYLPPTTTPRIVSTARPTVLPTDEPAVEKQTPNDETAGPNIAIATAVSGQPGGQNFYLLQPDGRLQRVVYQKSRNDGDTENEYTANYLFQNVQPDPGLVYSPLVNLGR